MHPLIGSEKPGNCTVQMTDRATTFRTIRGGVLLHIKGIPRNTVLAVE